MRSGVKNQDECRTKRFLQRMMREITLRRRNPGAMANGQGPYLLHTGLHLGHGLEVLYPLPTVNITGLSVRPIFGRDIVLAKVCRESLLFHSFSGLYVYVLYPLCIDILLNQLLLTCVHSVFSPFSYSLLSDVALRVVASLHLLRE